MLKSFRYLLFPFTIIYAIVIAVRNWLYDKNILQSASFNFPIICVGNIAVGGTGKTPMVEYLIRLLKNDFTVATLSRGYKRKTKGFTIANAQTTALEIGDEPMQFHQKFPDVVVAVGEERLVAIPQLLHERPDTDVIILDDAFQHRSVKAGLNIVLTEYKNLYTRDFLLPVGDLRDARKSMKRANVIIVTKCPGQLSAEEKNSIIREIKPANHQSVFFTEIIYATPYHLLTKEVAKLNGDMDALLLCGIANPKPLKEYIETQVKTYDMLRYADHHIFDLDDLGDIKKQFGKIQSDNKIIVTTEKDAVRLIKFEKELRDLPIYVIPIQHEFLFGDRDFFIKGVQNYLQAFRF